MPDDTEGMRRELVAQINEKPAERVALEAEYGQVWNTAEMSAEFEAVGFSAPFIVVRRKSDGKRGSLMFQHQPRYYFSWKEN